MQTTVSSEEYGWVHIVWDMEVLLGMQRVACGASVSLGIVGIAGYCWVLLVLLVLLVSLVLLGI